MAKTIGEIIRSACLRESGSSDSDFPWHPGLEPAPKVKALNAWIKEYAAKSGLVYVDYYSRMVNSEGGLKAELSPDGVHPNRAGYEIMAPLAEAGIAEALKKPALP